MPPVTVSESYDAVLTTTLRKMQPVVRDNISRGNKFYLWLDAHGRVKRDSSGGERIQVALMYALNGGADIYSGYGTLQVAPTDGITSAFFPWSQMAVPITISGLERKQNKGAARLINLLETKTRQSEASATQLYNDCVLAGRILSGATGSLSQFAPRQGTLDPSALGPNPLTVLIDANPARNVAVGSINGSTETWWRNQAKASTATTYSTYLGEKLEMYLTCSRGIMGAPQLILSDQKVYQLYWRSLTAQERFTDTNAVQILHGQENLKFMGAVHIWDEVVADVGTTTANVVDGIGTPLEVGPHGTEYHINHETFEWIVERDTDWAQTEMKTPTDQDATVGHLLWMGQCCVNNRRKSGVLYDVKNDIAA